METWSEAFSVGLPELDFQHKKILALISDLEQLVAEGRTNSAAAKGLLNEIVTYAVVHFETEEHVLAERQYAQLGSHREEHRKYVSFVAEQIALAISSQQDTESVLQFLKAWWRRHILEEDRQYKALFA